MDASGWAVGFPVTGVNNPTVIYNVLLEPYNIELDHWLTQDLIVENIAMI